MDNPILQKLGMLSNKMSANHVLQGISKGVMGVLPVIIVGAFASLFLGLPVGAWQGLIASTGLSGALAAAVAATTSMLGLYITFSVARAYGDELGVDAKILGVLAVTLYFTLMPTGQTEELGSFVPFTYLGTQGMIIGIIIAILTVHVYKFVVDKNIVIKMPEGTPPFVSNSFVALIPGFICGILSGAGIHQRAPCRRGSLIPCTRVWLQRVIPLHAVSIQNQAKLPRLRY